MSSKPKFYNFLIANKKNRHLTFNSTILKQFHLDKHVKKTTFFLNSFLTLRKHVTP